LFDLLVSKNLDNTLLKLCRLNLPSVGLLGLHAWVSEGFLQREANGGFFQGGNSGEISFYEKKQLRKQPYSLPMSMVA